MLSSDRYLDWNVSKADDTDKKNMKSDCYL